MPSNDPFNNIQLSSYKPTYVGLPIDEYEKSANLLENKYFQNRDQADKIQMAVSQADVLDKDKSIVIDMSDSINTDLSQAKEQWQFAGNIVRNTVKKAMTNPLFNAAIEDRKRQAANAQDQKTRLEKGEITDTMLRYGSVVDQLSNQNKLEVDPKTGIINNRWSGANIPKYVDKEKMAFDLAKSLPETYEGIKTIVPGMPPGVYASIKGKSADVIAATIKEYLSSNDQVQAYDQFMTQGKALSTFSQRDPETGKLTLRMPMNEDFKRIGIDVNENGEMMSKEQVINKDKKGRQTVTMQNVPRQLLMENDTPEHRLALWAALNTSHENGTIADISSMFAHHEYTFHKDEDYFRRKAKEENDKNTTYAFTSVGQLTGMPNYDYDKDSSNINTSIQHLKDLDSAKKKGGTINELDYANTQRTVQNSINRQNMLSGQYKSTKDGNDYLNSAYVAFTKKYPQYTRLSVKDFKGYIDGSIPIPNSMNESTTPSPSQSVSVGGPTAVNPNVPIQDIVSFKRTFTGNITKYAQSNPVAIAPELLNISDKNGNEVPVNKAADDFISSAPGAFKIQIYGDKGNAMSVADLAKEGITTANYDFRTRFARFENGTTSTYLTITPNKGVKNSKYFPNGAPLQSLVTIDDAKTARDYNETVNTALDKTKNPQAIEYAYKNRVNEAMGSAFFDAKLNEKQGIAMDHRINVDLGVDADGKPEMAQFDLHYNNDYLTNGQHRYKLILPSAPNKPIVGNDLNEVQEKLYNVIYHGKH